MLNSWNSYFQNANSAVAQQGLKRIRGGHCGDCLLDFGSNDYLGLSRNPSVLAALATTASIQWGSGASGVLKGYGNSHKQLEQTLSDFQNTDDAIIFSSGFAGNVGTISAMLGKQDVVFSDALNHASLIDGVRLSNAAKYIFNHCDIEHLRTLLSQNRAAFQRAMILTESIFSMDGDRADLVALADLADEFDCGLVIDEAHATGIYGLHGAGLAEELGLGNRVALKLGTLSKSLGGIGGYAAGSQATIEFLVSHCRSYLFSTAMPPGVAAAANAAIQCIREQADERRRLRERSQAFRQTLRQIGWNVPDGDSPIIPIIVGASQSAIDLSQKLLDAGIYVPAIRPPTVPAGTARLRVSLTALHSDSNIQLLTDQLSALDTIGSKSPSDCGSDR